MTMLDRMRRHKGWLKWSLGIVVVTFVLLYVPAFLSGTSGDGSAASDAIATIDGHQVLVGDFRRVYQQQVDGLRANNGAAIDDAMLKQLGMPQRVMQQLLDQQAIMAQAERLGLTRDRRRAARAHPAHAGLPGERPVHRRGAVPAAARHAAAAAHHRGVRTGDARQPAGREASGRGHRLDARVGRRSRRGVSQGEREGEARSRPLHRQRLPQGHHADRRRVVGAVLGAQRELQGPGKTPRALPLDRRRGAQRQGNGDAGRSPAALPGERADVLDARAGAREPHPLQDRRQERRGADEEGAGRASPRSRPAATSPRSPSSTPRTTAARSTAATSTTSARARWSRSSRTRPGRSRSARSATSSRARLGLHIIKMVDQARRRRRRPSPR